GIGVAFLAGTASAAEPAISWTGFYLGGGGGYGAWTSRNTDYTNNGARLHADSYSSGGKGVFGTVVAGYDYQFASRWVAGAFADYDLSDINGVHDNEPAETGNTRRMLWSWAIGGRIGYLTSPRTMVYGTGGYTRAHFTGFTELSLVNGLPQ